MDTVIAMVPTDLTAVNITPIKMAILLRLAGINIMPIHVVIEPVDLVVMDAIEGAGEIGLRVKAVWTCRALVPPQVLV